MACYMTVNNWAVRSGPDRVGGVGTKGVSSVICMCRGMSAARGDVHFQGNVPLQTLTLVTQVSRRGGVGRRAQGFGRDAKKSRDMAETRSPATLPSPLRPHLRLFLQRPSIPPSASNLAPINTAPHCRQAQAFSQQSIAILSAPWRFSRTGIPSTTRRSSVSF